MKKKTEQLLDILKINPISTVEIENCYPQTFVHFD